MGVGAEDGMVTGLGSQPPSLPPPLAGGRGMDGVWPNLNFELLPFLALIPRTDFLQMPPR